MNETYKYKNVQKANDTLNNILEVIVEGTWDWNANSGHVDRSPGWYRMLGYEVAIFLKNVFTWENIIHPDDYDRVMKHFELYINGENDEYCIEYRCKKADGKYIWIIDRGKIVEYNEDGTVARMIGAHQNIHKQKMAQIELVKQNQLLEDGNVSLEHLLKIKADELQKKNQELENKIEEIRLLSNTDSLTGIPNRKKFEEELDNEIARSNRYGHPISLAIFDSDYFKNINDTYGHKTGDKVLQGISHLVKNNIREIDFFARWGGDEFAIIFPDLMLSQAMIAIDKLRTLINQLQVTKDLFITCSFGLTQYRQGDTIEDLFQRADESLYRAKKLGRNRIENIP